MAATRLAVREGRRLAGDKVPLHLIGFSNGGALALMYALDALDDFSLAKPERIVLISPMVGITRFARFAGLAGLPAFFPLSPKRRGSGSCRSSILSNTIHSRSMRRGSPIF